MDCDDISAPLDTLSPVRRHEGRATVRSRRNRHCGGTFRGGASADPDEVVRAAAVGVLAGRGDDPYCGHGWGVTMSNRPETVACTDERALDVDVDQYRASEGPCLESARTRPVVRVRFDDAAQRWPEFASNVAGTSNVAGIGVASYFSAPLMTDGHLVGALNLYSSARSTRFF